MVEDVRRKGFYVKRFVCLLVLILSSPTFAQQIYCGEWGDPRQDFAYFENPVIGFSKIGMYVPESGIAPGWYIVEGYLAPAMGFAFYFAHDPTAMQYVYVDRLEIGQHEAIPAEEWFRTPFIDSPSLGHLFNNLAVYAPTCTLTPKAAR